MLLTEYLQQALQKPQIKIAYVGDNYMNDIYATHELDVKLKAAGSAARWDSIMVMEEMIQLDRSFLTKYVKPFHIPWEKTIWGESYFYHFSGEHPDKMKKWPI